MQLNYTCYKLVLVYRTNPLVFRSAILHPKSKLSIQYQLDKISRNKPGFPGIFVYIQCPKNLSTSKLWRTGAVLKCKCSKPQPLIDYFSLRNLRNLEKDHVKIRKMASHFDCKRTKDYVQIIPQNYAVVRDSHFVVEYLMPVEVVGYSVLL